MPVAMLGMCVHLYVDRQDCWERGELLCMLFGHWWCDMPLPLAALVSAAPTVVRMMYMVYFYSHEKPKEKSIVVVVVYTAR